MAHNFPTDVIVASNWGGTATLGGPANQQAYADFVQPTNPFTGPFDTLYCVYDSNLQTVDTTNVPNNIQNSTVRFIHTAINQRHAADESFAREVGRIRFDHLDNRGAVAKAYMSPQPGIHILTLGRNNGTDIRTGLGQEVVLGINPIRGKWMEGARPLLTTVIVGNQSPIAGPPVAATDGQIRKAHFDLLENLIAEDRARTSERVIDAGKSRALSSATNYDFLFIVEAEKPFRSIDEIRQDTYNSFNVNLVAGFDPPGVNGTTLLVNSLDTGNANAANAFFTELAITGRSGYALLVNSYDGIGTLEQVRWMIRQHRTNRGQFENPFAPGAKILYERYFNENESGYHSVAFNYYTIRDRGFGNNAREESWRSLVIWFPNTGRVSPAFLNGTTLDSLYNTPLLTSTDPAFTAVGPTIPAAPAWAASAFDPTTLTSVTMLGDTGNFADEASVNQGTGFSFFRNLHDTYNS